MCLCVNLFFNLYQKQQIAFLSLVLCTYISFSSLFIFLCVFLTILCMCSYVANLLQLLLLLLLLLLVVGQ